MKSIVLVFSGYNERAMYAFIRTLEQYDLPYLIIATSRDDPIFTGRYKEKVYATTKTKKFRLGNIVKILESLSRSHKEYSYFIAPTTETLCRLLVSHKDLIESLNGIVPLVNKTVFDSLSDKLSFQKLCEEKLIRVPGVIDQQNPSFPFVAKPKKYIPSVGEEYPYIVTNEAEKSIFVQSCTNIQNYFFQTYIDGSSYYLLFYVYKNGKIIRLSQENVIQQKNGKSMIAAKLVSIQTIKNVDKAEDLLTSLNFRGICMFELRGAPDDPYFIEANLRFWGPSQLMIDANQNLFECLLFDYGLLQKEPAFSNFNSDARYFWSEGFNSDHVVFHNYSLEKFTDERHIWHTWDLARIEI